MRKLKFAILFILRVKKMLTWLPVLFIVVVAFSRLDNGFHQCCPPAVDADPLGILLQRGLLEIRTSKGDH